MASGFTTTGSDFDAQFIRREFFQEGQLWTWGWNLSGELGTGDSTSRFSPVQTAAFGLNWNQISCGGKGGAGIKTDGTLWLWGQNTDGSLGNNSSSAVLTPVQTVSAGTDWKQISCGYRHTAAIKTDGSLWGWGGNTGDGTTTARSSPVQTIAAGKNWKQVSAGNNVTGAIKTDGTLWVWGYNSNYGRLGTNTADSYSSPVQTVAAGNNWKQVSAGGYHMAAVKTDGTLWTWGKNTAGGLGDNTRTARSSPVQTIAAGNNWKQVSAGGYNMAAVKTDGTLWTWGDASRGVLGDNTRTSKSSPVQTIAGGTNWKQVSIADNFMSAIKTDGTLWNWGAMTLGSLGNNGNNNDDVSSPIQTIAGGTNWKQTSSAAPYRTIAITTIN
jgi:hypothetical protein